MNGRGEGTTSSFANTAIYKKFYRPKSTKFEAIVGLEDAIDSKTCPDLVQQFIYELKTSKKVE